MIIVSPALTPFFSSCTHREKFFQEVNNTLIRGMVPLAKTKMLVKSLMNRSELLLHVTIAPHCRSLTTTPAGTPGPGSPLLFFFYLCMFFWSSGSHYLLTPSGAVFVTASKSVSDAKTVIPLVKQPVFLRSMSAPSDLEMIANQDLEFNHAQQRFDFFSGYYNWYKH